MKNPSSPSPAFIPLGRVFFTSALWQEPRAYSKAEALLHLLSLAHLHDEPFRKYVDGSAVTLHRFELFTSTRNLAKDWGWSVASVFRFLRRLSADGIIGTKNLTHGTLIRIAQTDLFGVGNVAEKCTEKGGTRFTTDKLAENQAETQDGETQSGTSTIDIKASFNMNKASFILLPSSDVPFSKIQDLWNGICTALPRCIKLTEDRKRHVRARWNSLKGTEEERLQQVESIFRKVQASDFLTCRIPNSRHWTGADFSWVFSTERVWTRIEEGKYDNYCTKPRVSRAGVELGPGEFLRPDGSRTYGDGTVTIPDDAPRRASLAYWWNNELERWC